MNKRVNAVFARAALVAVASVFVAQMHVDAAEYLFPNADASGDIASVAAWNDAMPDMSDTNTIVKITPDSTTRYTISTDMTLPQLLVSGGSAGGKATFDLTPAPGEDPVKVTMTGSVTVVSKRNVEFIGGVWDFGSKYKIVEGYQNYGDRDIVLSGGTVWTNVLGNNFTYNYGYGCSNNRLFVTDGSKVNFISNHFYINEYGTCSNVVIAAESGGFIDFASGIVLGRGSSYPTYHKLLCKGAGSRIELSGRFDMGASGDKNNLIEASDGGVIRFKNGTPYLTYSDGNGGVTATGNVLRAVGEGSKITFGPAYFGRSANVKDESGNVTNWVGSYDNTIEALDGGLISNQLYYVRGKGNGFVISNGVVATTGRGILCESGCTNAFVRFQGNCPRLIHHNSPNGFDYNSAFRFIYDLPPDGYAEGVIPMQAFVWGQFASDTKLEINGIEEVKKRMFKQNVSTREFVLWNFANGGSAITSDMVARWQSQLPEGAVLSGNYTLKLTIHVQTGTMLMFR